MKKIFLVCSIGLIHLSTFAQKEHQVFGGRAWGMGSASVTLSDAWAFWNNIAQITQEKELSAMFAYQNRFQVAAFQTFGIGVVSPLVKGVAGVSLSRFGDNLYSEQQIGFGYAYQIEQVSLGLKVNFLQVRIQDLGSQSTFVWEFGGAAQLSKQLRFAAHIYNLNQAKLKTQSNEEEIVPVILRAGLAYQPIPNLLVSTEVEKNVDFPANFKTGIDYELIPKVSLRTGIETAPFNLYIGAGFRHSIFQFDYGFGTQDILGVTHHISLKIRFLKSKSRQESSTN